jgi:hypothetical protein
LTVFVERVDAERNIHDILDRPPRYGRNSAA